MAKTTCTLPDCGKKRHSHGMCWKHLEDSRLADGLVCAEPGCRRGQFYRGRCGSHASAAARAEHGRKDKTFPIVCRTCGAEALVTKRSARHCSHECANRAHRQMVYVGPPAPRCDLPASHPARRREVRSWSSVFFVSGPCLWCGEDFTSGSRTSDSMARYCSRGCKNAAGKARRGAFVVPDRLRRAIYERDGWRCQLCGKRVGKKYPPSHNRAPSLDHIVPQSCGGSDDPSNLQLAHRICNSRKVAQVWGDGEQLLLLGGVA